MQKNKMSKKYLQELGNRIKNIRIALGYDQKTMSDALDTTQSRISKIEAGNASPTLYQLQRLKKVIEVGGNLAQHNNASWGWVLEGKDQKPDRQEHQWQSFLDNVALFVLRTDAQGLINYVNSAFLNTTGYSLKELLGKPISELLPENDRQEVRERIRTAAEGGVRSSVVRPMLAKDGFKQIKLRVAADNKPAQDLYLKDGFRATGINMIRHIGQD